MAQCAGLRPPPAAPPPGAVATSASPGPPEPVRRGATDADIAALFGPSSPARCQVSPPPPAAGSAAPQRASGAPQRIRMYRQNRPSAGSSSPATPGSGTPLRDPPPAPPRQPTLSPPRVHCAAAGAEQEQRLRHLRQAVARLEGDRALLAGELSVAQSDLLQARDELSAARAELAKAGERRAELEEGFAAARAEAARERAAAEAARSEARAAVQQAQRAARELERIQQEAAAARAAAQAAAEAAAQGDAAHSEQLRSLRQELLRAEGDREALRAQLTTLWQGHPPFAVEGDRHCSPPPPRTRCAASRSAPLQPPEGATLDCADEWDAEDAPGAATRAGDDAAAAADGAAGAGGLPAWHPACIYRPQPQRPLPPWHPHYQGAEVAEPAPQPLLTAAYKQRRAAALQAAGEWRLLSRCWAAMRLRRQRQQLLRALAGRGARWRALLCGVEGALRLRCWAAWQLRTAQRRSARRRTADGLRLLCAARAALLRGAVLGRLCIWGQRRRWQRRAAAALAAAGARRWRDLLFVRWPLPAPSLEITDDLALSPAARLARALRRERRAADGSDLGEMSIRSDARVAAVAVRVLRAEHLPATTEGSEISVHVSSSGSSPSPAAAGVVSQCCASFSAAPAVISGTVMDDGLSVQVLVPGVGAATGQLALGQEEGTAAMRLLPRPGHGEGDPCVPRGMVHISWAGAELQGGAAALTAPAEDPALCDEAALPCSERLKRALARERARQHWQLLLRARRVESLPLAAERLGLQCCLHVPGQEPWASRVAQAAGGRVVWDEPVAVPCQGTGEVHCRLTVAGIGATQVSFTPGRLPEGEWALPLFPAAGDDIGAMSAVRGKLFLSVSAQPVEQMSPEDARAPADLEELPCPPRVPDHLLDDPLLPTPRRLERTRQRLALRAEWLEGVGFEAAGPDEWDAEGDAALGISRRPSHLPDEYDPDHTVPSAPAGVLGPPTEHQLLDRALARESALIAACPGGERSSWFFVSPLRAEGLTGSRSCALRLQCGAQPARLTGAAPCTPDGAARWGDSFICPYSGAGPAPKVRIEATISMLESPDPVTGVCEVTLPAGPAAAAGCGGEMRLPLAPAAGGGSGLPPAAALIVRLGAPAVCAPRLPAAGAPPQPLGRRGSAERYAERLLGELTRCAGAEGAEGLRRRDAELRGLRLHGGVLADGGVLHDGLAAPVEPVLPKEGDSPGPRRGLARPSRRQPTRLAVTGGSPGQRLEQSRGSSVTFGHQWSDYATGDGTGSEEDVRMNTSCMSHHISADLAGEAARAAQPSPGSDGGLASSYGQMLPSAPDTPVAAEDRHEGDPAAARQGARRLKGHPRGRTQKQLENSPQHDQPLDGSGALRDFAPVTPTMTPVSGMGDAVDAVNFDATVASGGVRSRATSRAGIARRARPAPKALGQVQQAEPLEKERTAMQEQDPASYLVALSDCLAALWTLRTLAGSWGRWTAAALRGATARRRQAETVERLNPGCEVQRAASIVNGGALHGSFLNEGVVRLCVGAAATGGGALRRPRADALGAPGALWRQRESELASALDEAERAASEAGELLLRSEEADVSRIIQDTLRTVDQSTQTLGRCDLSVTSSLPASRCSTPRAPRSPRTGMAIAPGYGDVSCFVSTDSDQGSPQRRHSGEQRDRALAGAPGAVWRLREAQLAGARDEAYRACAEAERAAQEAERERDAARAALAARVSPPTASAATQTAGRPSAEAWSQAAPSVRHMAISCKPRGGVDVETQAESDALVALREEEQSAKTARADLARLRAELERAEGQRDEAKEWALTLCAELASAEADRQVAEGRLGRHHAAARSLLGEQAARSVAPVAALVAAATAATVRRGRRGRAGAMLPRRASLAAAEAGRQHLRAALLRWVGFLARRKARVAESEWVVAPDGDYESVAWRRSCDRADRIPPEEAPYALRGSLVTGAARGGWVRAADTGYYIPQVWLREAAAERLEQAQRRLRAAEQRLQEATAGQAALQRRVGELEGALRSAEQAAAEAERRAAQSAAGAQRRGAAEESEAAGGPCSGIKEALSALGEAARTAPAPAELHEAREQLRAHSSRRAAYEEEARRLARSADERGAAQAERAADAAARRASSAEERLAELERAARKEHAALGRVAAAVVADEPLRAAVAAALRPPCGGWDMP
eukprot:TRINITY_DN27567_c0_g1_i2.p1 TRINITY_DN27567_c0_g1~~TRINITY_DN27567_c0_g1_i2.p1  ORF type:complete len:2185 (+),score=614.72 TRINITY_DN27567_c0_g1_i2:79-6555(+)